jgi:two-component system, LuxR family, response regulator FixJ
MAGARSLPAVKPLMIAVVDDDLAVCSSLKFSLELEGFSVRTFVSATEFLETGLNKADCLVIDQRMPVITGMELIGQLRAQNVSTPVILIVSQPNVAVSGRAASIGTPIVEKPFFGNALVDKIRQVCRQED